jgi:hypothetical protein
MQAFTVTFLSHASKAELFFNRLRDLKTFMNTSWEMS